MASNAKPRISVMWILIGIFLGIPIVMCGGVGVWWVARNSVAQAKLDQEIASLKDKGMPVDDRTMADFHNRLTDDLYTAKWLEVLRTTDGKEFIDRAKVLPVLGTGGAIPEIDQPWKEQQEVEQFLEDYSETTKLIHEIAASDIPVRFPLTFDSFNTLLENTQAMRGVARFLSLEHEVAVRNGETEREYNAIQSLLGTAIALRGEPIMVSQLVSVAIHGIALGKIQTSVQLGNLSEQQWLNISNRLSSFDDFTTLMANAIAGERAMALPVFLNPGRFEDSFGASGAGAVKSLGARPIDALSYLRVMEQYEAIVDSDLNEFLAATEKLDEDLQDRFSGGNVLTMLDNMMTGLIVPAIGSYSSAVVRNELSNRLAKTGIAIRVFRIRQQEFPSVVSELASLPFDLTANAALDGKPFGYRKTEEGAVLWGYDFTGRTSLETGEPVPSEPPTADSAPERAGVVEYWRWEFR